MEKVNFTDFLKETNLSNNKQKDDLEIQKYSTVKETKIPDRKYLELVIKDTAESHMRTQLRRNYPRKYLIMEASKVNPGKFDVTEGRIGVRFGLNRPRKYSLSMNEWDSFYLSKISKGWDAKLEYNSLQIKEILLGLEAGLDVSIYTILDSEGKPVFDAGQMSVIREGLKKGLDVSKFTILNSEGKPVFNYDQMCEILRGLESGVDVSQFTTLNSEGKPVYEWRQMWEIRKGLEAGVDVSQYTILDSEGKPEYECLQMREIREDLERKQYITLNSKEKPVYNDDQMREIRKGLECGIPLEIVKREIANPDFLVEEMAERREKLDEELYKLGKEGLLEKYGIILEKENSEVEKDENTLDTSEEISL